MQTSRAPEAVSGDPVRPSFQFEREYIKPGAEMKGFFLATPFRATISGKTALKTINNLIRKFLTLVVLGV
jgi:hypothetical protein